MIKRLVLQSAVVFLGGPACAACILISATMLLLLAKDSSADTIDAEAAQAGLSTIPFAAQEGITRLRLKIKGEPRCFFGDRDAIGMELAKSSGEAKLLLSIERIAGAWLARGTSPLAVADITSAGKDLKTGYQLSLAIKVPSQMQLYGIYICKDTKKENQCASKKAMSIPDVLSEHNVLNKPLPANYQSDDKIYFFKYLLIGPNTLFAPTQAMTEERYVNLNHFFSMLLGKSASAKQQIETAKKIASTLQSRPLGIDEGGIVLTLPGYDPRKCGRPGTQYLDR